jgi:acetyltransferase EpsM
MGKIALIGGGGHAMVVGEAAVAQGYEVVGFYDDDPKAGVVMLAPYLGNFHEIERLGDVPRIIAVGDIGARRELIERVGGPFATVVHPSAIVSPSAELGGGVFVGPLAVLHARARVGDHTILNTASIVEHDCALGTNVHVAPTAALGGGVRVGPDTLFGLGAKALPGARVGARCVVGVGCVVVSAVGDDRTVVGVPARESRARRQ